MARRHTWKVIVPVVVAGLGIALAAAPPAGAADYRKMSAESSLTDCLTVSGSTVQMSPCTSSRSQRWRPVRLSRSDLARFQRPFDEGVDGYVRLQNQRTGKCLALVDNVRLLGTRSCSSGARTVWANVGGFQGAFGMRNVAAFDFDSPATPIPTRLSVEDNDRDVALTFSIVGGRSVWHLS